MDLRVRQRMKVAAWVAFLLLSVAVLAYASGYRLPQLLRYGGRRLPATPAVGAILVRTTPRSATVSLDGVVVDERTPTGLGSVAAGPHRLRIERAKYQPWEKTVEVVGGAVHAFLSVRLFPKERAPTLVRDRVSVFSIAPSGRVLLTIESSLLRLHNLEDEVIRGADSLTAVGSLRLPRHLALETARVSWTADSSAGALLTKTDQLLALFTVDPPSLLPSRSPHRFLGWYPSGAERAVTLTADGDIRVRTLGRSAEERVLASGGSAAAIHPRGVLIVRDGKPGSVLTLVTLQGTTVLPTAHPETAAEVAVAPDRTIALIGGSTGHLSLLKPDAREWEQSTARPTSLLWSPDGSKLAYRESPFDVWVLNHSEERSSLPKGVPELVLRLSDPITTLAWFPDSQYLLVGYRDILSLVAIDPRDGHERVDLLSTNRGNPMLAVDRFGAVLYAIAVRDGLDALVSLPLLLAEDR